MQRTMFLLRDARIGRPVVVDLFRVSSAMEHSYDYPIHFRGQLITTNAKYAANSKSQTPLGTGSGYQHIWKTASGPAPDGRSAVPHLAGGLAPDRAPIGPISNVKADRGRPPTRA